MEVVASSKRILLDSRASEGRGESRSNHRQPSYRACIFPLYRWIPLGDGLISSLESVIGEHSVSNDTEVEGASVNPCEVLAHHQAQRLRANIHDMLRGTGQTETQCRYRLGSADDDIDKTRGGGQRMTTRRVKKAVIGQEESRFGGSNAESNLRRRPVKRGVYEARKAVLQQNEKVGELRGTGAPDCSVREGCAS